VAKHLGLLVAVCLPLFASACSSGPSNVVERFTTAAAAGDTGKALDEFDPDLKSVAGIKLIVGLNQIAAKAKARGGLRQIHIDRSDIENDHGTVSITETLGDGSVQTDTEKVRKVDGRWFVTI
jgi:hypothetical protein